MPFSIWVTGAERLEQVRTSTKVLGRGLDADRAAIVAQFAKLHPRRRELDDSWVVHTSDRQPWFRLRMVPTAGPLTALELSTSYVNPEFMKNALGLFDVAVMLAQALGGQVIEEVRGERIDAHNIDAFLAPDGAYTRALNEFSRASRRDMVRANHAPLEVPVGAIDEVSDYLSFVFRVPSPPPLATVLGPSTDRYVIDLDGASGLVCSPQKHTPLVRVLHADDGIVVRPAWSSRPFAEQARETFAWATRLEHQLGVTPAYDGAPCDAAARDALAARATASGVELYEWLRAHDADAAPAAELGIEGGGLASAWTTDAAGHQTALPRTFVEDDFRIEPACGLAVVARSLGATGGQGRPAAVLAVWSIVGEVRAARAAGQPLEVGLARGFARARAAVRRLTWSWRGPQVPVTSAVAVLVDGDRAIIAHVGAMRVSRLAPSGLAPLTEDHIVPGTTIAMRELTDGEPPTVTVVPVAAGDVLLLAPLALHRSVRDPDIAAACTPDGHPVTSAMRLLETVRRCAAELSLAHAIVHVVADASAAAALGGSMRPVPSWLFQPGDALPAPPAGLDAETGPRGPDARWFAEGAGPRWRV